MADGQGRRRGPFGDDSVGHLDPAGFSRCDRVTTTGLLHDLERSRVFEQSDRQSRHGGAVTIRDLDREVRGGATHQSVAEVQRLPTQGQSRTTPDAPTLQANGGGFPQRVALERHLGRAPTCGTRRERDLQAALLPGFQGCGCASIPLPAEIPSRSSSQLDGFDRQAGRAAIRDRQGRSSTRRTDVAAPEGDLLRAHLQHRRHPGAGQYQRDGCLAEVPM